MSSILRNYLTTLQFDTMCKLSDKYEQRLGQAFCNVLPLYLRTYALENTSVWESERYSDVEKAVIILRRDNPQPTAKDVERDFLYQRDIKPSLKYGFLAELATENLHQTIEAFTTTYTATMKGKP